MREGCSFQWVAGELPHPEPRSCCLGGPGGSLDWVIGTHRDHPARIRAAIRGPPARVSGLDGQMRPTAQP